MGRAAERMDAHACRPRVVGDAGSGQAKRMMCCGRQHPGGSFYHSHAGSGGSFHGRGWWQGMQPEPIQSSTISLSRHNFMREVFLRNEPVLVQVGPGWRREAVATHGLIDGLTSIVIVDGQARARFRSVHMPLINQPPSGPDVCEDISGFCRLCLSVYLSVCPSVHLASVCLLRDSHPSHSACLPPPGLLGLGSGVPSCVAGVGARSTRDGRLCGAGPRGLRARALAGAADGAIQQPLGPQRPRPARQQRAARRLRLPTRLPAVQLRRAVSRGHDAGRCALWLLWRGGEATPRPLPFCSALLLQLSCVKG
jgi:hypothetical protein